MAIPRPPEGFTIENIPAPPQGFRMESPISARITPTPPPGFTMESKKGESVFWNKVDDIYEHLAKPTAKAMVKVPLSLAGGMAAFVPSGVAGYAKLLTSGPEESVKTIEQVQGFPMRWIKTDAEHQAIETIMKPLEWIETAGEFYGDKVLEHWPDKDEAWAVAAGVKSAFEITSFFGLPKLAMKLRGSLKARKIEAAKEGIREVHKERLRILRDEPKRLETLAQKEQQLVRQREKIGMPLLRPKETRLRSVVPPEPKTTIHPKEVPVRPPETIPYKETLRKGKETLRADQRAVQQKIVVDPTNLDPEPMPLIKPEPIGAGTFSFMGTQGIYEGIAKNIPNLKQAATRMKQGFADTFDVEAPYKRIAAPETGFRFKNFFSQRTRHEDFGLNYAKNNAQLFNFNRELAPDVVLMHENPVEFKRMPKAKQQQLKPAIDHLGKFFKDYQKEYKKRGVELDFKQRIINDIQEMIGQAEPADAIKLEEALSHAKQMEFTHIPSAIWFDGFLNNDPIGGSSVLRLLATQKRKTLRIQDLVDRGVINRSDIHPADIIASYSRRAGRDFALLDIVEAASKEGLASLRPKEGYVKIPAHRAPILSKYHVHPLLADHIYRMTKGRGTNLLEKVNIGVKMAAFYNPLFLPGYDIVQGAMLGSFRSIKTPKYVMQAVRDVYKKTPEYWEALDNGLASQPFNNPFDSWQGMLESIKKSRGEKVAGLLENVLPQRAIKNMYNASWHIAWELDKTVRMASYRYLMDKGYKPREAAQIAAKFHSDYASVPIETRKVLNHMFFTPTFKITMAKLHGRMMADAVKTMGVYGKVDKTTMTYAKGLIATGAILEGWDMFMKSQGFETDEWGRRYVRRVETDEGEKELVLTYSNPANQFLKYVYRAKASKEPHVEQPMLDFIKKNKWEYNRIAQIGYEMASGESATGEEIYNLFDTPVAKLAKTLKYGITRTLPILTVVGADADPSNLEARKKFKEETSQLLEVATRPFTFKYMRSPEERRAFYKLHKIKRQFDYRLQKGTLKPEHLDVYQKRIEKVLSEVD